MSEVAVFNPVARAFKAAGYETPLDEVKALLQSCRDAHPEDAHKALLAFSEALGEANPMLAAIIDDAKLRGADFKDFIRRFAFRHAPWWRRVVSATAHSRATASRLERAGGYSKTPAAIRLRRSLNLGEFAEAPAQEQPPLLATPYYEYRRQQNVKERDRREDRKRRGVVPVRAEVNLADGSLALVGQLPPALRMLEVNASRRLLLDMPAEEAAAWCGRQEKYASVGAKWAAMCLDPRKTLRENLTPEIVARLSQLMDGP